MTIQQLRYAAETAACESLSEAARRLYVSQPSLTKAIHDLEDEIGLSIFVRSNRGVAVSRDGEVFLRYARQVLDQMSLLERQYGPTRQVRPTFCVSTQHYAFAVNALVDLINACGGKVYDFRLRETQTYEIIEDVASCRSELGILYLDRFNESVLGKVLQERSLTFTPLLQAKPHVFLCRTHPLARRAAVSLEDMTSYPYLSFEQGTHNSFYFSEEVFASVSRPRNIMVRDRATLFNLLRGLDGYTISSGILDPGLNGDDIVSVPLSDKGEMRIGVVMRNGYTPNGQTELYLSFLRKHVEPVPPVCPVPG